jgi:predicted chitinase
MLDKAIQDVLETVVDSDVSDSTDSADGGAAPSDGKGIMSREVDSREDAIAAGPEETIPPQIVFLNDSTTNKGSTERDVYQYAYEQGIKGDELQSFMSQVAHESSKFGRIKEAGYLETKVNDSWVERTPAQIAAKLGGSAERKAAFNALANNKTFTEGTKEQKNNMIFDILYDDQYRAADVRLGNTEVGDGSKYKGRGYIQLTGRDNYKVIGEDIGEDLENNPELMLNPAIAKRASVAWWKRNVRSQQPDYTNTTQITRLVNGRLTGLESRKKYFKRYGEKPTAPQVSLRPSARPDTRVASN